MIPLDVRWRQKIGLNVEEKEKMTLLENSKYAEDAKERVADI